MCWAEEGEEDVRIEEERAVGFFQGWQGFKVRGHVANVARGPCMTLVVKFGLAAVRALGGALSPAWPSVPNTLFTPRSPPFIHPHSTY